MQSFKQYLSEAGKGGRGVTRDEAKSLLKTITSRMRPDMSQPNVQANGDWWDLMIRDYEYFTPRPGEEDDDWPEFTGEREFLKKLSPILKGIEFTFSPEEKDWITISLKQKKLSAKQMKADGKKKIESVMGQVEGESRDAQDGWYRKFYANLMPELKKHKNKFITKEEFFNIAERTKWYDSDAAEEVWSMA